ncbi:ACT domain-containing protein [Nocardioides sp.]|uniref:ACT domain-containing protein n=1 Tax=Nocardioides sp. TaxID=35761 RepID=UPI002D7EE0F3|nr:ACT domain-containing protein [Nocardioides sp.]HET8960481.1 ACT domain-containing protein [Nocardioides sp.]
MPFLLRVELPDVPGSLGRLASAIGEAGGDIEAIEIIEKGLDGLAIDDVLLELTPGALPDAIVSACTALEGVQVLWISRYAAGGNLFLDLEAVEDLTAHPERALDRLVDLLPGVFRCDWGARVHRSDGLVHASEAAPDEVPWVPVDRATTRIEVEDDLNLACATRVDDDEIVVMARRGGPDFLDSELARLGHLTGLALSIAKPAR